MLSGITAPRLARRLNPNSADSTVENDQVIIYPTAYSNLNNFKYCLFMYF